MDESQPPEEFQKSTDGKVRQSIRSGSIAAIALSVAGTIVLLGATDRQELALEPKIWFALGGLFIVGLLIYMASHVQTMNFSFMTLFFQFMCVNVCLALIVAGEGGVRLTGFTLLIIWIYCVMAWLDNLLQNQLGEASTQNGGDPSSPPPGK